MSAIRMLDYALPLSLLQKFFFINYAPETFRLYRDRSGSISDRDMASTRNGLDRAVRRKAVVRTGQGVWVYGFSPAPMAGVTAEEHDRCGVWSWRAHIGQTYEAMECVPLMFFRCR